MAGRCQHHLTAVCLLIECGSIEISGSMCAVHAEKRAPGALTVLELKRLDIEQWADLNYRRKTDSKSNSL